VSAFIETLIEVAQAEVGVKETGLTNRGPRVDDYQRATWLEVKDWGAWCAAFVCFCVREALVAWHLPVVTSSFERPRTASAFGFEKWSLAQDSTTQTRKPCGLDIKRGDLVIFSFSHIGIATSAPDGRGFITTIEGNSNAKGSRTGGMVCEGVRSVDLIRSRIRFTI
jgi:hypothetical protein